MRHRISIVSLITAIMLIFVVPAANVSAATFTYEIKSNTCTASGGMHGYGHLNFKVRLQEYGNSGANKFTFGAKVQHKNLGSNNWQNEWNAGTFRWTFPSNSESYWYTRWWNFDPNDGAWHRFRVTLKVWHGSTLLASRVLNGKTC